jgi:hypothetical protein
MVKRSITQRILLPDTLNFVKKIPLLAESLGAQLYIFFISAVAMISETGGKAPIAKVVADGHHFRRWERTSVRKPPRPSATGRTIAPRSPCARRLNEFHRLALQDAGPPP